MRDATSGHISAITDVAGVEVGVWTDPVGLTGCTVVLCPHGAIGAVDVRGGAPGTRETDVLASGNLVEHVHAIVLAGGSAFGLAASTGVMRWLARNGFGFPSGPGKTVVPIVPSAVIFDLAIGDPHAFPDGSAGEYACEARSKSVPEGLCGAGIGCTIAKLPGLRGPLRGGQGTSSIRLHDDYGGYTVGAVMVVNAVGAVGRTDRGWYLDRALSRQRDLLNTTIGVVATDAPLDRDAAARVARMAHDGLARALDPIHTPYDGDTIFVIAVPDATRNHGSSVRWGGLTALELTAVGATAAHVVEESVVRAVRPNPTA